MKIRAWLNRSSIHWLTHRLGLAPAASQTTAAERACLARHARDRRNLVEIGVMHGVCTALLRSVMHPDGTITGIDPLPAGRLGVSFEFLIAERELARHPRGRAILLRRLSHEAAASWTAPIDFLFVDGDHSWAGIERDWNDWSPHIVSGGMVALHDSRSDARFPDLDSVRYTQQVIAKDPRFRTIEEVDRLTILQKVRSDEV